MEIKYNKKKRIDIKGWLLGGNSKIYMIILILFVTLAVAVLGSLNKISLNNKSSSQDESVFSIDNQTTADDDEPYIEESQSYKIRINKSTFVLSVYRLLRDDNYVPAYTFHCAINSEVETGQTFIQGKQIWIRNTDWSYGHYGCILGNGAYISSAPYWHQDTNNLSVKAYNKIGTEVSVGSIYLKAADAKWIYENCGINISVEIYELPGEEPEITLDEFVTLPGSAYYDPSDIKD
jgi:hypothetical protein